MYAEVTGLGGACLSNREHHSNKYSYHGTKYPDFVRHNGEILTATADTVGARRFHIRINVYRDAKGWVVYTCQLVATIPINFHIT